MNSIKSLLTLLLLAFCTVGFSQEDLIGEWYLQSFTINEAVYNNVYQNISTIDFSENPNGIMGQMEYNGSCTCNGYFGGYSATINTIDFSGLGTTLADCYNQPLGEFENLYFSILGNNFMPPSMFNYLIQGSGNNQTLTLTNSSGDNIIYSKTNPNAILHRTWYLQSLNINGTTYNISSTDSPSLIFGFEVDPVFMTIPYTGTGDCNEFSGEYGIYFGNGDEIKIFNFSPTTNICDPVSDFEEAFFSIFSDSSSNTYNFEIINDGDNLVLTRISEAGGRLSTLTETSMSFSKQSLSSEDYSINTSNITISENPVRNQLKLTFENVFKTEEIEYQIYSIEGKVIMSSQLNQEFINVEYLNSGIYFIRFSSEHGELTLKFIKK